MSTPDICNLKEDISHKTLRIGFDFRYLQAAFRNSQHGGVGGIGVYTQGLWRALTNLYPEHQYVAIVDRGRVPERLETLLKLAPDVQLRAVGMGGANRLLSRFSRSGYAWLLHALESECGIGFGGQLVDLDIFHVLNQSPGPKQGPPVVMTMYDFCQLGAGEPVDDQRFLARLRRRYLNLANRSEAFVCISQATALDMADYFPASLGRSSVAYPGIDLSVFNTTVDEKCYERIDNIEVPFLLHVGVCAGRKNPRVLLEAVRLAAMGSTRFFKIAFVGPYQVNVHARQFLEMTAQKLGISDRVIFIGDTSDAMLANLYRRTVALVFPSLYEGFGYPAAEAIACGARCITSNISSMPEAVGPFGILVDPNSPTDIGNAIITSLGNNKDSSRDLAASNWAKKFSWDAAAGDYMRIYYTVARLPR